MDLEPEINARAAEREQEQRDDSDEGAPDVDQPVVVADAVDVVQAVQHSDESGAIVANSGGAGSGCVFRLIDGAWTRDRESQTAWSGADLGDFTAQLVSVHQLARHGTGVLGIG